MTSRSTASPSRLPSRAVPWILMRSTVTGFAPGTTSGTLVCTWAVNRDPNAKAIAIAPAKNSFMVFIPSLSPRSQLLDRIRIDVDAEGAHGKGVGKRPERLFFDLNFGPLVDLHRCVDGIGSPAPQLACTGELRSVDRDPDALFGVGWIEHGNGERLAIFAQSGADIERVGVAAGIDRRLVAAGWEGGLGLRRVSRDINGDGAEVVAVHLEEHAGGVEDGLGLV